MKAQTETNYIDCQKYTDNLLEKIYSAIKAENPSIMSDWQTKELAMKHNKNTTKISGLLPPRKNLLSAADVYKENVSSVFMVGYLSRTLWDTMPHVELMATAFALNKNGAFVTNYHVMRTVLSPNISSRQNAIKTDSSILFLMDRAGKIYFMDSLLAYDENKDVAIFQIKAKGNIFSPIRIGSTALPGASVYCLANPDNNFYYFSQGIVNQYYVEHNKQTKMPKYIMSISADYAVGSSGGPIFDQYGNLTGMVSFTRAIYSGYNQQGQQQMILKQAIPIAEIKKMIK